MKRNTFLLIALVLIVGFGPVINWSYMPSFDYGLGWRVVMLAVFGVGLLWSKSQTRKPRVVVI